jgi:uncharacterized membrane protein YtjA (UPF0391 family)
VHNYWKVGGVYYLHRRDNSGTKRWNGVWRRYGVSGTAKKEDDMLWTIFVVLLVLWLLGLVSSYTLGGFIHLLLVLAVIVLVINLVSGRRGVV